MQRIRAFFERGRARASGHPFFQWLHGSTATPRERFAFTPVMIDFTMGFADMNKWFLSYPEANGELQRAINQHTLEDRTHSRLFLENWHALELDDRLGWSASQTLWWLYHCPHTLPVRRFGWEILELATRFTDPLVRFALMEAIEICGDVFFQNSSKVAIQLSRQTSIDYRYYGEYHRLRETGHLHTDESPFFAAQLTAAQLAEAELVTSRIFNGFQRVLDCLLSHCKSACAPASRLQQELHHQYRAAMARHAGLVRSRAPRETYPGAVAASQAPLIEQLRSRQAKLGRHPFLSWLQSAPIDAGDKLRRFTALWAVDIAGYPDFNTFALTYTEPRSEAERAINQWAAGLAGHGVAYLRDWRALGLDEQLGWSAGETVAFTFLNDATEIHRCNLAKVTRHAFRSASPLARFWLMSAFEAGGDPLFDTLSPIVSEAERVSGPLDYWAERHWPARMLLDEQAQLAMTRLLADDVSTHEQRCISDMIDDLFDNFDAQFSLSLRHAQSGTFIETPRAALPSVADAPRIAFATRKADRQLAP